MSSVASEAIASPSASTSSQRPRDLQPDETPTIRFTNVQSLFHTISSTPGDILVVTGSATFSSSAIASCTNFVDVSPGHFAEIERERERTKPSRRFRFRRYESNSRILVITIPTKVHEKLHLGLYDKYNDHLAQRCIKRTWDSIGSATLRRQGHPGGDAGEGDSTGFPIPDRIRVEDWPTLVIEAGDSESLPRLHDDMRWWFTASNHDVKIVLLAKFDHRQHLILLERWEEEEWHPHGVMTGNRAAIQQQHGIAPVLRQTITITHDTTANPAYNVTRGALVLRFKLLFLRDPRPGEEDFLISVQQLQDYTEEVWRYVQD